MLILPKHHWTQYLQGTYEPETFKKIKEIFKNKKIKSFWDIGANAGMYTIFIAKRYSCQINSFEPSKKYHKFLKLKHLKVFKDFDLDVEDNLRHTLARKRWKKGMRLVMAVNRMKSKVKMLMNIQRATKAKAIGSPLTPRGTPKDIIVGGGFSLDDDDDDEEEESQDSHDKIKKSNTTA